MATTDPDPRIGIVLDNRYRILHRVSEGSMGIVYRGERVPVGKPVAVKFLHAAFSADAEFLQRFERETRLMSKLTHPHCVSVLDFGVEGGPYMVMDFVTGVTLREVLDDGPLPWPEALGLMRQLLAGLAHAHSHGIVHRDVKPANVMVSDEIGTGRHVRILDFGLARLRGTAATSVTQTAVVVGTPNYMAPEQTVAGETDARTDLYAAGIILFEMVTGQRPFAAPDTMELFNLHRTAPVPRLRDAAPGVDIPPGLDEVVRRALAKDRSDRFPSAVEFAESLDSVAALADDRERRASTAGTRRGSSPHPDDRSSRGWAGTLLAGLAIAAAVAAGVVLALRRDGDRPTRASAETPALTAGAPAPLPPPVVAPTSDAAIVAVAHDVITDAASVAIEPGPDAALAAIAETPPATAGDAPDAGLVAIVPAPAEVAVDAGTAVATVAPLPAAEPASAEPADPDPAAGEPEGETEAPDAPPSAAAAEAREAAQAPAAKIAPARSIAEARAMLKRGQRGPALIGLRELWRKNPRNASLPYLMGNIYYDIKWWSVALDHYKAAIQRGPAYRRNSVLIRNVIHMMGTAKTRGRASWFLRKTVGRPAKPYLKAAAKRDPSPAIRRSASWLAKQIR